MDNSLNVEVVNLLKVNGLMLATAESCTGGLIASSIVDVPGSSEVFFEGVVTYSNESKIKRLRVNPNTLKKYGAVSEQTAEEMATGLLEGGADIAVATTGIAGPSGGTKDKPVGLVYIAVAGKNYLKVEECNFDGDRTAIRNKAKDKALSMVALCLQNIK